MSFAESAGKWFATFLIEFHRKIHTMTMTITMTVCPASVLYTEDPNKVRDASGCSPGRLGYFVLRGRIPHLCLPNPSLVCSMRVVSSGHSATGSIVDKLEELIKETSLGITYQ